MLYSDGKNALNLISAGAPLPRPIAVFGGGEGEGGVGEGKEGKWKGGL